MQNPLSEPLLSLIEKWRLRIEPYSDPEIRSERAKVIYAQVPHFKADLLLAVITEDRVQNCANELIDEFLKEFDPIRARQLMDDMQLILERWDELEALIEDHSRKGR